MFGGAGSSMQSWASREHARQKSISMGQTRDRLSKLVSQPKMAHLTRGYPGEPAAGNAWMGRPVRRWVPNRFCRRQNAESAA